MLFLWQEIVFEHVVQILAERSLRIEGQQKAGPHEGCFVEHSLGTSSQQN